VPLPAENNAEIHLLARIYISYKGATAIFMKGTALFRRVLQGVTIYGMSYLVSPLQIVVTLLGFPMMEQPHN
jgi:membrane protein required for beta-lactamase induction